jgi:hypothetical protein
MLYMRSAGDGGYIRGKEGISVRVRGVGTSDGTGELANIVTFCSMRSQHDWRSPLLKVELIGDRKSVSNA